MKIKNSSIIKIYTHPKISYHIFTKRHNMAFPQKTFTPVVVFTDLDEEFDDKLAVYFISKFGIKTTVVFMPSSQGTSQDGLNEWKGLCQFGTNFLT